MVDQPGETTSLNLGWYATVLRRRWPVVAIGALLGAAIALAYVLLVPQRVTATALVKINVVQTDAFSAQKAPSELIDPMTEELLARSSAVYRRAASALGRGTTSGDIRRNMGVDVVPDATVARFTFTAPTRREAVRGADAISKAYVAYRTDQAAARVDRIAAKVDDRLQSLRAQLVVVNGVLARAPSGSAEAVRAQSDRQVLEGQLNTLLGQVSTVESVDTAGGSVATTAADNSVSIQPRKGLLVEAGTLLGLILGLIAAFVVEAMDRRVRDPRQMSKAGGGAVLATLDGLDGTIPASGRDLDELRSACEKLIGHRRREGNRHVEPPSERLVLTVVDLTQGHEPSDVGPNLASCLADTGRAVDLVLPAHSPELVGDLAATFGVAPAAGAGATHEGPVISVPGATTAAPSVPRAGGVGSGWLPYEKVTIIVLPPNASRAVMLASARLADSVLLVVARGRTSLRDVSSVADDVQALGTPLVGNVVVRKRRALSVSHHTGARAPKAYAASG